MADPEPPTDPLSSLRARVAQERKASLEAERAQPQASAASLGWRMGGEFGAAILVGALLGFGVDHYLGVAPWGLFVGLGLGFVAGIVNVTRAARAYSAQSQEDMSRKQDGE